MKTILTDCDGCLLYWEESFHNWMKIRGYNRKRRGLYSIDSTYNVSVEEGRRLVEEFNNSSWMAFLPPFRDARSGVARLVEAGYDFICITSVSLDPCTQELRKQNLERMFGKDVFTEIVCLDIDADKDAALAPYKDTGMWWIEDKWKNAVTGVELGLKSIVIEHAYNKSYIDDRIVRVKDWEEIYEVIVGERAA